MMLTTSLLRSFPAFLALNLAAIMASGVASALPPEIHWEKIETPHFTVVYDAKQPELGELYARSAEQAFHLVSPTFGLWPDKTVIIVDDSTDIANGSATGIPYPLISAYPVLPASLDSVADYGNWGLELITHEYTHILNFEPATGVMKPLRYIFGSIIRPNILLPRWYSEGLAVEMETRRSSFGRLRSANYLSIMRAMVEDEALHGEDISRVNEVTIPDWPGGIRPYLMGALLIDEVVRRKGDGIIRELNLAYSRRMPFFINGPVEERLGIGWSKLLTEVYRRAEKMTEKQLAAVRAAPQPAAVELAQPGFFSHSPVVSPDHQHLAYIGKEHNVDSLIYILDRDAAGKFTFAEKMPAAATGLIFNRVSWTPDSKALVHDGVETFARYRQYSDLWIYDLESKKNLQLTHGLRAREPVVSPDGKWIVFEQLTPGSSRLAATRIDGSDLVVLYTPPIQTRISRPEFLSANELIFSEKQGNGDEVFKVVNVRTGSSLPAAGFSLIGEPRVVLADFQPVHYPRLTPEGLLFVSDRSGAANLYLASSDLKRARAVTNTTTRVMTGELDPVTGDLYFSKLLSFGPQLHRSPREAWRQAATAPPQIGAFVDQSWPEFKTPEVDVDIRREDYSPWWYLLPRYWMPYVYVAPGISYFSASTSAADPTGRHSYTLQAAYDTLTTAVSVYGTYTNQTTTVPITLTGLNAYDYIYGGWLRQTTDVNGLGSFYVPGLNNHVRGALGWDESKMNVAGYSINRSGPEAEFAFSNLKQRGLEISPERGGTFALDYRHYLPGISDIEYDVTDVRASKFLSGGILPERHVAAFFLNASLAPRLNNLLFGTSTLSGSYQTLPGIRGMVMRGYNPGVFIGRNLWSGTFEYRFPLSYTYSGFKTAPFFIQRWHAAVFADALTLDGLAYDYTNSSYNSQRIGSFFYGTGMEVKLDATIFYHLPIQFIFGLYYGTDARSNPAGLFPVVSFGL